MIGVALALIALAAIDGGCSGFRASLGRSGLVRHGPQDRRAAALGLGVVLLLLVPAALSFGLDVGMVGTRTDAYTAAGRAMLTVLLPYAVVVCVALTAYGLLGWRQKYLAMAVVLGPFTLARPLVAVGAAAVAAFTTEQRSVLVAIALATAAVMTVEPVVGRLWFEPERPGPARGRDRV